MNLTKKFLGLLVLLGLISCSNDPEKLDPLFIELDASNEAPLYNEPFTLTWSSNASQCYGSGAYWSGERPTSGSEEFTIRRGGTFTFILECRRNNEFLNQAVAIDVTKTPENHFIFLENNDPALTLEIPEGQIARVTSYNRGDFNNDSIGDIFFALQYNQGSDHVQTKYFQLTGGPFPVLLEIAAENCKGSGYVRMVDFDQDSFDDVIVAHNDSSSVQPSDSICIFEGSESGLKLNNGLVANETDLDLANADVRFLTLIDKNLDAISDVYLLTSEGEYWVVRGTEEGPAFEKAESNVSGIDSYTITAGTLIDFDSDSNNDILFAAYDANNLGAFIAVPRSAESTDWDNITIFENAPLAKIITSINFDDDANADLLVVGDQEPSDIFNPSPTVTFTIYEEGESGILDSEINYSFSDEGIVSLGKNLFITDYDLDFDGGDFLFTLDPKPNNFANFMLGIKTEINNEEEPTAYEINTLTDKEMNLDNFDFTNAQSMFVDLDLDFDLDALVIEEVEANASTVLNFYLKINQSN